MSRLTPPPLLEELVRDALRAGADAADAMLIDSSSMSVGYRLGKVETLERAESEDLGLRVFVGKKQAVVSSTDRSPEMKRELVERAVAMARLAPADEFCGLADRNAIALNFPDLELADTAAPDAEKMILRVREAEEAALSVTGVTNSDGAEGGSSAAVVHFVASNGFSGSYRRTSYSLSVTVLAGDRTEMQRDYDYATTVKESDLPDGYTIGRKAGEKAVKRLGPRKMPTGHFPVVFENRLAGGLLGQLAGAISGSAIARGTSFLKDKLGEALFDSAINVIEDPFRPYGLRSRPFDAEGMLPEKRNLIKDGVLTSWLLDLRSARQLGMTSTGNASRSPGGQPSPSVSNFYLEPGHLSVQALLKDIPAGFFVTDLMGMGVNAVTGDYSQAAAGFWIENGEITFPVNEMTIAGNLKDMYRTMTPANDLEFRRGVDAPTVRIEGMTVGGV